MLRYYYINRGWIVSSSARRVYRIAASLSLSLFFVLFALSLRGLIPNGLVQVLRAILLPGVLGAATTMIAMEYFLFGFDDSSALKKMFWFCVMLLPPLGPALYCFLVYSRSKVVNVQRDESVQRASA